MERILDERKIKSRTATVTVVVRLYKTQKRAYCAALMIESGTAISTYGL